MYALVDTNVWLSALTCDGFCRRVVDAAAEQGRLGITPYIRDEVWEKLVTKFRRPPEEAARLVGLIAGTTKLLAGESTTPIPALRDPDDRPVLAAAIQARCQFLVTGEKELLELKSVEGVEIVTVREFAQRLGLAVD